MDAQLAAALVVSVVTLLWIAVSTRAIAPSTATPRRTSTRRARTRSKRSRSVRRRARSRAAHAAAGEFGERFDSHDARFLGAPVDYVVFDGLSAGVLREVVLVEVKTGSSRLTPNEREVELAIAEGRVSYEVMRLS